MLSIVDLIDAGTITPDLAAHALGAIGKGASFMVGALPGGAGKTTVMGALLNGVPADVELLAADGMPAIRRAIKRPEPRLCCVCHEISPASYYAYLWGEELRAYFDLPDTGHIMATNLHADTYEQAYRQVCGDNRVRDATFRRMDLIFFLAVRGRARRVATVWESTGDGEHQCVFKDGKPTPGPGTSALVTAGETARARRTVDDLMTSGIRTIRDVRAMIVDRPRVP